MKEVEVLKEVDALRAEWSKRKEKWLQDYMTFLRFPSVSTDPMYKEDVLACCEWLADYVRNIGFDVEIWPTSGYPVIFASHMKAGPDQPTLLIYNHYDVQPVDPIEEWHTLPFEPYVKGNEVMARGAQDNKGQCFYTLQAIKFLLEQEGKLPVNIKLCIEGEEECGSKGISSIVKKKQKELQADYLAIVDMGIPDRKQPVVTLGVRGIVAMDVELVGSSTDMHSGACGGIVYNPIHGLAELLARLHDANGKVTVPGFYDSIVALTEEEKKEFAFHFDEQKFHKDFHAQPTGGEQGYSPNERAWIRPTLEINGISGGYSRPGFKTVIPAKAYAKISCRLVPNQEPDRIVELVIKFLKEHCPNGLKLNVHVHEGHGMAFRAQSSSKIVQAFKKAYEEVLHVPCEYALSGGSIPIAAELAKVSNAETVLVGFALSTDCIHAPNEHFGLDRIEDGFLLIVQALRNLSNTQL